MTPKEHATFSKWFDANRNNIDASRHDAYTIWGAALQSLGQEQYGCYCDLEHGQQPDGCVLDEGRPEDCVHARFAGTKESCAYWQPFRLTKTE